ncbi:MAG: pyrophosphate phosphatase [Mycobacterium sp.]|jgi:undecaprenyl-diphosphatase|nr:pyrophosphate phosphatase [Mycobacterium sp.]
MALGMIDAVVLGIVEGLTEFLPVSSTGHLTVVEELLGYSVKDEAITAFTAVIQVGAIVATLLYFRRDIVRLVAAGVGGLVSPPRRQDPDFRFAWLVVAGSVPIGIVGLAAKSLVEGPLRNLYVVAGALIVWSAVMVAAERVGRQDRRGGQEGVADLEDSGGTGAASAAERSLTLKDVLFVGVLQCVALIPGVSRSGATISGGLFRGLDRVTATRLSFFLAIPALLAAGGLELPKAVSGNAVGAGPLLVGTLVAFLVAYATIAWLLRFVAAHPISTFVPYRIAAGLVVIGLVASGAVNAR